MSQKIKISGKTDFRFRLQINNTHHNIPYKFYMCSFCNYPLHSFYIYLIDELKKTGLIDEDYPLMCCSCFNTYRYLGFVWCKVCGHYIDSHYSSSKKDGLLFHRTFRCIKCGKEYEPRD